MLFLQRSQRSMRSKWGRFEAHQGLNQKKFFAAAPAGVNEPPSRAEYHVMPCSFKRTDGDTFISSTFLLLPGNSGKFSAG